ncbi:MAG: VWA domain-containing protein [Candidatus Peribacteria bacterium]|nr:MAG: VWA domain-containing protein [Candidatus Peribacteria bacterium]
MEEIHSFGDTSTTQLLVKINQLTANGWTPITDSLIKAKEIIKKHALETDKNIILLISDGKETCGSDPVEEALNISKDLKNTYIDVIGFNVTGDTQKQLIDIAKN